MSTPHLVDFFITNKITLKHISCGQYHTAAISNGGALYTWGAAKFNQLGHGTRIDERYPRLVVVDKETVGKFLMVACGDRHTAAVSEARHVYTFGSGPHGQLGHGNGLDCQYPTRVQALEHVAIKSINCGSTTTAAVAGIDFCYAS
jgi:alpha-tubulin suppressor-like RCC1 family protein